MDVSSVIRHRLKELGLEQRDLAAAALVTESYISQLLARKKAPPTPGRTDIYHKIETLLKLPAGELSRLADLQRREDLKKKIADPPQPYFGAFRELILGKCAHRGRAQIRDIFEKEPFGVLERLVTQQLLNAAKRAARDELERPRGGKLVESLPGPKGRSTRATVLRFLDIDIFQVSSPKYVSFVDSLIESWDIDLETLDLEVILNHDLATQHCRRFAFVERKPELPCPVEPGLEEFLDNPLLSGDATEDEVEFLKSLRFKERRPLALYYYRILQDTRDPLHFKTAAQEGQG